MFSNGITCKLHISNIHNRSKRVLTYFNILGADPGFSREGEVRLSLHSCTTCFCPLYADLGSPK